MSNLMLAGAGQPAPVATTATELAARIPCRRGCPSATTASRCATSRRRHMPSGSPARRRGAALHQGREAAAHRSMFLGGRVDDALSAYYRRLLEHGDRLPSTRCSTSTATTGPKRSKTSATSRASTGKTSSPSGPRSTSAARRSAWRWPSSCRTSATRSTSSAGSSSRSRPGSSGASCATSTSRRSKRTRAARPRRRSSTSRSRAA